MMFDGFAHVLTEEAFLIPGRPGGINEMFIGEVHDGLGMWISSDTDDRQEFARSVASVGDVNGDGFDDIAMGAPNASIGGILHVMFGRPDRPALELIDIDPPNGAIDARRPDVGGGLQESCLTLASQADSVTMEDLSVSEVGGDGIAPVITAVVGSGDDTACVQLDAPVEPGSTLIFRHACLEEEWTISALPGDVNGDGLSGPLDILALIDHLNGRGRSPLCGYQCDIDFSGVCAPLDILMLVDVLSGAGDLEPWNGTLLTGCR
jgi:hypothetical protein